LVAGNKKIVLIMQLLEKIKGLDWANEKEFRLSLPKAHPSRYIDLEPYQIYIGKNCDKDTENSLLNIAKKQKISAYKMTQGSVNEG